MSLLDREKIFIIGFPKTGTTSVEQALRILGYKLKWWPENIGEILNYDAFSDGPVWDWYKSVDRIFKNSRFIFTYRGNDEWLKSCKHHYTERHKPFDIKSYNSNTRQMIQFMDSRMKMFGQVEYNSKVWLHKYLHHMDSVAEYFHDTTDVLLSINVCEGEGWKELCDFLGKPIPNIKFPKTNTTNYESE